MQNNAAAVCVLAVGVSSMDRPISMSIAAKKCLQFESKASRHFFAEGLNCKGV